MYKLGLLTARKKRERKEIQKEEGRNKVMLKRPQVVPSAFGKA